MNVPQRAVGDLRQGVGGGGVGLAHLPHPLTVRGLGAGHVLVGGEQQHVTAGVVAVAEPGEQLLLQIAQTGRIGACGGPETWEQVQVAVGMHIWQSGQTDALVSVSAAEVEHGTRFRVAPAVHEVQAALVGFRPQRAHVAQQVEEFGGVVVAAQHHGGRDAREAVEAAHRAQDVLVRGPVGVEQVAAVHDQIRLHRLGYGDDLGQDGVELCVPGAAPQSTAQMPVGCVQGFHERLSSVRQDCPIA